MIANKIVLANLLKQYKFTTKLRMSDLKFKVEVTLNLVSKWIVGIEKRDW